MKEIEKKAISTLRVLATDMINKANSGHSGIALGAAPIIYTLYTKHLVTTPKDPFYINRDRFILSAGHGSSLLYAMNYLYGYDYSIQDLKEFRQLNSKTPGHPEYDVELGIEATTGPLGQGIGMAVGLALAETYLSSLLHGVVDHYTYSLCGDGDLQEGVAQEAISLAGHLKLNKLIVLFDSNDIQLDGPTSNTVSTNYELLFKAHNWNYIVVSNAEDIDSIDKAIIDAKKSDKPTLIEVKSIIGFASPLAGSNKVHGVPLGATSSQELRKNLNYTLPPFEIDDEVIKHVRSTNAKGDTALANTNKLIKQLEAKYPELHGLLQEYINHRLSLDIAEFQYNTLSDSTRNIGGKCLDFFSSKSKFILGGSADLASSTKVKGSDGDYSPSNRLGRNINFGVREFAMGTIINGLTLHGLKAFSGAFLVFSDYMKASIRLAAIMQIPSIFVFTHDSIAVGEDGPTHEPIEQLVGLRTIPNVFVFRPSNVAETIEAFDSAFSSLTIPHVIVLSRQNLTNYKIKDYHYNTGANIVHKETAKLEAVILATGSEVEYAYKLSKHANQLASTRVVSVNCLELFKSLSEEDRNSIVPPNVPTVCFEMGRGHSWFGLANVAVSVDHFGASGKDKDVIEACYSPEYQEIMNEEF
jgi:transketolase